MNEPVSHVPTRSLIKAHVAHLDTQDDLGLAHARVADLERQLRQVRSELTRLDARALAAGAGPHPDGPAAARAYEAGVTDAVASLTRTLALARRPAVLAAVNAMLADVELADED